MSTTTKDLLSFTLPALTALVQALGEPAFRGGQIFSWLHEKNVESFDEMTNLSLSLRENLAQNYHVGKLIQKRTLISAVDGTIKYLYGLEDGNAIETVLMHYKHGTSLCLSTQVGCRMGCTFCASTQEGRLRNLTVAEMLGQVYSSGKDSGTRIDSIVLMGIGEPLDNFDHVIQFLQTISHPKGKNLGLRHITLSTCGMVDKIYALAEYHLPITLSISLHAVTDKQRSEIMPINKKWNIDQVLTAAKDYFKATGRRVTYEYALIRQVNDSEQEAMALAKLLNNQNAHVNLIPVNPVASRAFQRSSESSVTAFARTLAGQGINATIRRELGSDILAACGQLRQETLT